MTTNQLTGRGLAEQYAKLTRAIEAGINKAKGAKINRAGLFLVALHEAGFDVVELAREADNALTLRPAAE